jgi:hypothetical protein
MSVINYIIENKTPYVGKLKLKLEKNYDYQDTKKGVLNKVHFNFGFIKLVSRLVPNIDKDGWILKENSIQLIEKYTNCLVGKKNVSDNFFPNGYRNSYFLYIKNGGYVCDLEHGWWMYQNGIQIYHEFPQCMGLKFVDKKFESCYIFCGGQKMFIGIGDKVFEPNYRPSKIFHDPKKWKIWHRKYKKDFMRVDNKGRVILKKEGMSNYLPLQERGRYVIKNQESAIDSAKKILIYLSEKRK